MATSLEIVGSGLKGNGTRKPQDLEVGDELLAQDSSDQAVENTRREITGQKLQAAISTVHNFEAEIHNIFFFSVCSFPCSEDCFISPGTISDKILFAETDGIFLPWLLASWEVDISRGAWARALSFHFLAFPQGGRAELLVPSQGAPWVRCTWQQHSITRSLSKANEQFKEWGLRQRIFGRELLC